MSNMQPSMSLFDHLHTIELATGIDVSEMAVVQVVVPPARVLRELVDEHGVKLYIVRKPPVGGLPPLVSEDSEPTGPRRGHPRRSASVRR
jgi:hypothetical protein